MSQPHRSYAKYVRLQTLLSCQKPMTLREDAMTWGAERFFIICHQTSELWLSQILVDLGQAARLVEAPLSWTRVRVLLTRAASLTLMLARNVERLASLCPREDFLSFRPALEGMSASESPQFDEMFQLIGSRYQPLKQVEAALAQTGTCTGRGAAGPDPPGRCVHDACASAEALRVLLEGVQVWRLIHVSLVRDFIGDLPGTGGSSGVDHLLRRAVCAFPEGSTLLSCPSAGSIPSLKSLRSRLRRLEREARGLEASS